MPLDRWTRLTEDALISLPQRLQERIIGAIASPRSVADPLSEWQL